VVEDDQALGDLVQTVLADEGYAVSLLSDVREESVRAAIGRLEPDCILLDSEGMASYGRSWEDATWAHVRARPVPVVMFTANSAVTREALAAETPRSREAAFFAVLDKPFRLDDLLDVVARAVGTVCRFDRSAAGESARATALVAKLAAAGARDIDPSVRREWATFRVGDTLCLLYWSHRDGVYYVLHQERRGGSMQQMGRFHDLDLAVDLAVASVADDADLPLSDREAR